MAKIRVYELAKELETESKKLVDQIIAMGIDVKNHMSTLEDDQVAKIQGHFKKPAQPVKEAPKAANVPSQTQGQDHGHGQVRPQGHQQVKPAGQQDAKKPEKIKIPMKARFEQSDNRNRQQNPNQQQRPQQGQQQQRPQQGQGQRPQQGQGQRPQQGQGQRPQQGQGQRPQQGQGQRPQQGQGQRPQQGQGQRPQQGQGQRPQQGQYQNQRNMPSKPFDKSQQRGQHAPEPPKAAAGNITPKQADTHKNDHKPVTKPDNVHNRMGKKEREEQKLLEKKGFNKSKHGKDDRNQNPQEQPKEKAPAKVKTIKIGESISVQDLAFKMNLNAAELIKKLIGLGVMATINQEIDSDTAVILGGEFGFEVEVRIENLEEEIDQMLDTEDAPETLQPRPAVVTVMGHVDHGKTSLLDAIRHANVIASEAGGITQHIGAYQVEHNNKKITFLDTPGHAAFTAMRARGAEVTDVSVLVVAADDGVMPQTIEAINHSKAANVPVVVAINKMDKPGANPDRVKQELMEHGLVAEEWGGQTICVPVSAKTKEGLSNLLEMILLVAEVGDLKANPDRSAKGTVIEAQLDKGRGSVATVLVQTGTLNVGDPIVAGTAFGRVRAMMDYKGRRVKKAGPSMPVEVLGLSDVPQAGDTFYAVEDEKLARTIATKRINKKREEEMKHTSRVSLEDLFKQIQDGEVKDLNIIIKADVQGSIEALKNSLQKLSTDEVRVNPIHGGVGAITETDIMLASASNAIILGFNVRPDANAKKAAEAEKVDMRLYRVIYNAIEDIKAAMTGLLDPEFKEVVIGTVEVRQIFKVSKVGTIAGCYVTEGKITKNAEIRLIRDGIVLHEGKMDSLKRFKDDAKEVAQGFECGITIEKFNDINEGDTIEAFVFEEVARQL